MHLLDKPQSALTTGSSETNHCASLRLCGSEDVKAISIQLSESTAMLLPYRSGLS